MTGSSPTPAEQHLGDRLAALVDGELKHDVRDRVLAHLATCPKCKAEADAQRRLKNVFAQSAPPPPSEGLLARLQGLPAGPGGDDDRPGGPFDGGRLANGVFAALNPSARHGRDSRTETFGYVPAGAHATVLPGSGGGFRIHEVGRSDAERSPWLGRRFVFAAASAVSFAAIALGGAIPLDGSVQAGPRGEGAGNSVTPLRAAAPTPGNGGSNGGTGTGATPRGTEAERRRGGGNGPARSDNRPVIAGAPSLLAPAAPLNHPFSASILTDTSSSLSPLIRPTGSAFQLATAPGLLPSATPAPTHLAAPTQPSRPLLSER
ncbi:MULTISPECIES: zf-HC2 domain-containing protein [unclassified Streptomyces]|uniref:anti-sigma factor family protein n=1 Tax=unclassified Streptomyces TaxID=2593676 RepID=UPI002DDBA618|nr:zf-HC2 domain-containing protein [Streptomyces sp. NBC_01750]WSB00493.1 zf-HC2 domain-containing protein [Streptomyces sp. NBC_01794]WSD35149.1 zf-HC2 domain-containing protein [Streptomyces sp. NBC_01750]